MATFTSIFVPIGGSTTGSTTADISGSVSSTTSSSEILLGRYNLFALNANGDINIRFGASGMPNAVGTDFRVPADIVAVYRVPQQWDRMKIYNPGGSSITYWIQPLSATT